MSDAKVGVGVIGTGDVAQVIHLPTLQLLSYLFETKAVCDVSKKNADHCAAVYKIPIFTTDPNETFQSREIDAIILLTYDKYHAPYAIAALEAVMSVLVEELIKLSIQSAQKIIEAEKIAPNGARVFVGNMRRYAASLMLFNGR
jgi:predicted dehydrogenase